MNWPNVTQSMLTPDLVGVSVNWFSRVLLILRALGLDWSDGTPLLSSSHLRFTNQSGSKKKQNLRHLNCIWNVYVLWIRIIVFQSTHWLIDCPPCVLVSVVAVSAGALEFIITRVSSMCALAQVYCRVNVVPNNVCGMFLTSSQIQTEYCLILSRKEKFCGVTNVQLEEKNPSTPSISEQTFLTRSWWSGPRLNPTVRTTLSPYPLSEESLMTIFTPASASMKKSSMQGLFSSLIGQAEDPLTINFPCFGNSFLAYVLMVRKLVAQR